VNELAHLHPTEPVFNISLFSGYGGLDEGVRRAVPGLRTVAYVEREAFAVASLVAQMEAEALDQAPVFTDVTTFDGKGFADELFRVTGRRVRSVTGGFPCQDISLAGKGGGLDGERSGLWFRMRDIIRDVRPDVVFLENVAAITGRGLDAVLGSLADIGYDAEWLCLRASDVGAPHGRNRWFCLARRQELADAAGARRAGSEDARADRGDAPEDEGRRQEPERVGGGLGHPVGAGLAGREPLRRDVGEELAPAERAGDALPLWPPRPRDGGGWASVLARWPHLAPATVGAVRRVVDGFEAGDELCLCPRGERLRLLGNGVVPAQAAYAFSLLCQALPYGTIAKHEPPT
jgi:DNA (cytosine-5)-methyltransferase 1